ncbi:MAG: hypothetical protein RLZZ133_1675 [Pseudomonadota bacterium]|jgi:hypothetical protein
MAAAILNRDELAALVAEEFEAKRLSVNKRTSSDDIIKTFFASGRVAEIVADLKEKAGQSLQDWTAPEVRSLLIEHFTPS